MLGIVLTTKGFRVYGLGLGFEVLGFRAINSRVTATIIFTSILSCYGYYHSYYYSYYYYAVFSSIIT